jgi:ribosomal protein L21
VVYSRLYNISPKNVPNFPKVETIRDLKLNFVLRHHNESNIKYVVAQVLGHQEVFRRNNFYDLDYINPGKVYRATGQNLEGLLSNDTAKNKPFYLYLKRILLIRRKSGPGDMENKVQIGQPFLKNVTIPLMFVQHIRGKKIAVFKYRPKKHYRRMIGHRQYYSRFLFV